MGQAEKKYIRLIFVYLVFFGLSLGVWQEYSQLWLSNQDITISNIGIIIAAASFITGIAVILLSKYFKKINELLVLKIAFVAKIAFMLGMVLGSYFSIKGLSISCFIVDSILNNLITLITYPIITHLIKNEQIYSKRKLIEYTATDFGLLLASFLIGRNIGSLILDFNFMLILSMVFIFGAALTAIFIKNPKEREEAAPPNLKRIFKDKISCMYLVYYFIGQIAYFAGLGMLLLLIINYGGLTTSHASLFVVACYIAGDIFGYLALKKLTPKNDYITILLKFGVRFLFYVFVIIFPTKEMLLAAIVWSLLVSRAFENKTDGIYVNRCEKEEMFAFIHNAMSIPVLRAAIFSASPEFFKSLTDTIHTQSLVSPNTLKKLYISTLQYYLRATTRTTPYGLFVGVSLGSIGDKDDIVCSESNLWKPCVELDTTWLSKVIQSIEDSPDADSHILYSFNKNLYVSGSRLINPHNAYKVYTTFLTKELTSIRYTALIHNLTSHFKDTLFTFKVELP